MPDNLRPELAEHLQQRLTAFGDGFRHNLALIGPPGSGKTFQLHHLLASRPPNVLTLYCPLYRESCRSFLQRLLGTLLQAGLGEVSSSDASLERLLRSSEGPLPNTTAAICPIEHLLTRRLYGEAFNRTLDVIPVLVEERRQPCVLILDEFLFLEELGLVHAFHELGKRVMTWPSTLFILSSSAPYRARAILRERLHLLFGQFELLTLDAVEPTQAATWVQRELRGLRGVTSVSPFLVRWLGGSPAYLAVFLRRLKELAVLRRIGAISETLLFQTAWDVLGNADGTLHQWCLSKVETLAHARHGDRAIEAVLQIAQGVRTTTEIGQRIGRVELSDALQELVEHDAVQRKGACWLIPDPVLRCWLTTILSAQRGGSPLEATTTRARFEQYLTDAWRQWLEVSQLSFSEHITRLFTNFRDDTVSLDSKTGRLPRFQTFKAEHPATAGPEVYLVAEGQGRSWCCSVQEGAVDENAIAEFDAFCRRQTPKPSRKIVITKSGVDANARLLAKARNMWIWQGDDLDVLAELYGRL